MSTQSWSELSENQRLSWFFLTPFILGNAALIALLYVSYVSGLTDLLIGNAFCSVLDALNADASDLTWRLAAKAVLLGYASFMYSLAGQYPLRFYS